MTEDEKGRSSTGTTDSSTSLSQDSCSGNNRYSTLSLDSKRRLPSGILTPDVTLLCPSKELSQKAKLAETLGSFKSAKLDLESTSLVGRSAEVHLLRQRLFPDDYDNDNAKSSSTNELILLSGMSGTGKSRLAACLQEPCQKAGGIFSQGKFEPNNQMPYAAIIQACDELCKSFSSNLENNSAKEDLKEELERKIDAPLLHLMMKMMPAFGCLVQSNDETEQDRSIEQTSIEITQSNSSISSGMGNGKLVATRRKSAWKSTPKRLSMTKQSQASDSTSSLALPSTTTLPKELIKVSFTTLIQILSSRLSAPIVLLIDDLQWADIPSLELMMHLLLNPDFPHKIILEATYRSDEVQNDPTHPLHPMLRDARDSYRNQDPGSTFVITEVPVGNFAVEAICELLGEVLSIDDASRNNEVAGLAKIILVRTAGNVFFVKLFIGSLQKRGLLEFNHTTFSWKWDNVTIEKETMLTENVISVLQSKMISALHDGSSAFLLVLQIASCLGNTFEQATLELIVDNLGENGIPWINEIIEKQRIDTIDLTNLLEAAVEDQFLIYTDTGVSTAYRFLHDKVREAAISLIPDEDAENFKASIGRLLYEHLPRELIDDMLFVVIELLNAGAETSIDDSIAVEVVELNALAGEKAAQLSSYGIAGDFADTGLKILQRLSGEKNIWDVLPHLALRLYTVGVEAAESTGDHDKSVRYCNEVLQQKVLPPLDTIRIQCVVVERMHSKGIGNEAIRASLAVLDKVGCAVPKRKTLLRLEANLGLKDTLRKYVPKATDISKMKIVDDQRMREVHGLILRVAGFAFGQNHIDLYVLLACHAIQWTKQYGLTEYSAPAMVTLGNILMHVRGNWKEGTALAKLALTIQDKVASNYTKSTTIHKSNTYIFGWTTPLKQLFPSYMEGYRLGMLSGNIEAAAIAIWCKLCCEFCSGGPLDQLKDDLVKYTEQMKRLHLKSYRYGTVIVLETVTYLMGETDGHLPEFDEEYSMFKAMWRAQLCACYAYGGDYIKGADLALLTGDSFASTYPGFYFGFEPSQRGICLYIAAKQTGKKKYWKAASKVRACYRQWVQKGGVNFVHMLLLFDAEDAVLRGNTTNALELYEKAIQSAVRGGFVHNAALATQRYASFLKQMGRNDDAEYYRSKAIEYYVEWGAHRQVENLKKGVQ